MKKPKCLKTWKNSFTDQTYSFIFQASCFWQTAQCFTYPENQWAVTTSTHIPSRTALERICQIKHVELLTAALSTNGPMKPKAELMESLCQALYFILLAVFLTRITQNVNKVWKPAQWQIVVLRHDKQRGLFFPRKQTIHLQLSLFIYKQRVHRHLMSCRNFYQT